MICNYTIVLIVNSFSFKTNSNFCIYFLKYVNINAVKVFFIVSS